MVLMDENVHVRWKPSGWYLARHKCCGVVFVRVWFNIVI